MKKRVKKVILTVKMASVIGFRLEKFMICVRGKRLSDLSDEKPDFMVKIMKKLIFKVSASIIALDPNMILRHVVNAFNPNSDLMYLVCSAVEKTIRGSKDCLLYTSPSPRDQRGSRMPSSA